MGASHCNLVFFTKWLYVLRPCRCDLAAEALALFSTMFLYFYMANSNRCYQYDFWFDRALGAMLLEANDWSAAVDRLPRQMPLLPHGPNGTILKARLKTPLNHPSLPWNLAVNSKPAVTHTSSTRVGHVFEVSKPCLSDPPDHGPSSYTSHIKYK